ncbi:MAG: DEAD/DEAH box helicase, partial [Clostridia bacterium]|nr:DEAD/DEAH box helicase [Clostridia bacterium]
MEFKDLGLKSQLLKALEHNGFVKPTEVQELAIPVALEGKSVVVRSQTGSGKTLAFGLPIINNVDIDINEVQVLVICPTRELASQVTDEFIKLIKFTDNIKVVPVFGGSDMSRQINAIKGAKIIVGTPGRIMDHMRRKTLKLHSVKSIVLDEADEMLEMGFKEDVETILKAIPNERQTLLFSATFSKQIKAIISNFLQGATNIEVGKENQSVKNIVLTYTLVSKNQKREALVEILNLYNPYTAIVFCNTKSMVSVVASHLRGLNYKAVELHGDLRQSERKRVMDAMKTGRSNILVATDVAARGIDINDVDYIINFDLPQKVEYFLHRIGRTARAGKGGNAVTIITTGEQLKSLKRFEIETMSKISEIILEGIKKHQISTKSSSKLAGRKRQENNFSRKEKDFNRSGKDFNRSGKDFNPKRNSKSKSLSSHRSKQSKFGFNKFEDGRFEESNLKHKNNKFSVENERNNKFSKKSEDKSRFSKKSEDKSRFSKKSEDKSKFSKKSESKSRFS